MGTRSITEVVDDNGDTLIAMYRQMDGYPSGMGADLAAFLDGFRVVNGLGFDNPPKTANGLDCLAAQLVAEFKEGAGSIYMVPPSYRKGDGSYDMGEEYIYTICIDEEGELTLDCVATHNMTEVDLKAEMC